MTHKPMSGSGKGKMVGLVVFPLKGIRKSLLKEQIKEKEIKISMWDLILGRISGGDGYGSIYDDELD